MIHIQWDHEHAGYNIKPSDHEAPVLELCKTWSTPSLPLPLGPLWSRVVVPILCISQIELFTILETVIVNNSIWNLKLSMFKQMIELVLDSNTWNHLTVCKQISSGSFKNVTYKLFTHTHTHTHTQRISH